MNHYLIFALGVFLGMMTMLFAIAMTQASGKHGIEKRAIDIINSPDSKWTNEQIGGVYDGEAVVYTRRGQKQKVYT